AGDARGMHEHPDRPEAVTHLRHRPAHRALIADVARHYAWPRPDVEGDSVVAVGVEPAHDGRADGAGTAGDDDGAARHAGTGPEATPASRITPAHSSMSLTE